MKNLSSKTLPKMLPIRLKESTYNFFDREAKKRDRSKAWVIRSILEIVEYEPDFIVAFLEARDPAEDPKR